MAKLFKLLLAASIMLMAVVSCTKEIENRLDDLEDRVSSLEQISEASKNGDIITSIVPIIENSVLIGYSLQFKRGNPLDVFFGKDGSDGKFQNVSVTDTEVTFVTADGQVFVVRRAMSLSIEFDSADLVVMGTNATRNIHYTITSDVDDITIEALSSADIKVKVVKADSKTGALQVKTGATIDEYTKVVVLVSNGSQAIMRTLNFEEEAIEVEENTTKEVSDEGGEVTLEFFSNTPCHAEIPEDAQSWISVAPETKGMERQTIELILKPNNGAARSATVIVRTEDGTLVLPYLIEQGQNHDYQLALEREALIAFYKSLDGDNWEHNDNWCSEVPLHNWYGVSTDNKGFVIQIDLGNNKLHGTLPEQLWDLIHLKGLNLPDNDISGEFPKVTNNKCAVAGIDLARNKLSGGLSFLTELKNLTVVYLNENHLSGPIPTELANLKNIQTLYLWKNSIRGQIPAELGNCKKLKSLSLSFNYLSGDIPEAIGNAPALEEFTIDHNNFTGRYPQWLLDDERFRNNWLLNIEGNLFDLSDVEIPAPTFDIVDVEGNHITSEVYSKNRYTILFRTGGDLYLSDMRDVYNKYHNLGVEIIGLYDGWDMPNGVIYAGEDAMIEYATEQAKQHKTENNIPWPCCIGRPVFWNPQITIIDNKGRIVFYLYSFQYPEDVPLCSFWPKWNLFLKLLDKDLNTHYSSTDYSRDGEVKQIQASTEGHGIDLVLMGDGYTDRLLEDGTYDAIMRHSADAIFIEEPYKSFRNLFNIYYVTAISENEEFGQFDETVFESAIYNEYISANNWRVLTYAKKAVAEDRIDNTTVLVVVNQDAYAGTCYMYNKGDGDSGNGLSIGFIPAIKNVNTFNGLISHEICGHGFAKLADEYGYEENGQYESYSGLITTRDIDDYIECGWYKNVDFTSDPAHVKWAQFIADPRYASEDIGCYEGGLTYWTGVWRPTEASIMRYNTGGFNAPSRYAIWYRIGKLANGESWEGTYEDFVAYDAVNRTPAAIQRRAAQRKNYVQRPLPQLPPPVVVGHSWREELQKK